MKLFIRFGCIVLFIVLLFGCFFSVSADTDGFYSLNILDYSSLDNSGGNSIVFSGGQVSFFYDLPLNTRIYESEAFIKVSGSSNRISTISCVDDKDRTYEPSFLHLGSGYYRLLFDLRGNIVERLTFNVTFEKTSQTSVQFYEFLCSPLDFTVYSPNFNGYITWYTPGGSILDREFLGVNSFTGEKISCVAYRLDFDFADEWQKYDYIDLCLSLEGCTIDSVNVMLSDDIAVPFELKEIVSTTADTTKTTYTFMVSIDLTSVARSGDLYVLVRGSGGQTNDSVKVQSISANSCKAYVLANQFNNPIIHWLQKTWLSISNGFNSNSIWLTRIFDALKPAGSESAADDFKDKVDDQASELEDIKDSLDSVEKPNAADINMNIDTYVPPSDLTIATSGLSTVLNNEIMVKILLMVITFAIVGFILYGKR